MKNIKAWQFFWLIIGTLFTGFMIEKEDHVELGFQTRT